MQINGKKIVCLGGGVGTANLLAGLKHSGDITAIVSMADDGGSAGRLRRLYHIPPSGDVVNCMIALSDADEVMQKLLAYRFPGDRYAPDNSLHGQKIANLMFAAMMGILKDFPKAIAEMEKIFKVKGKIYPSTLTDISIWAKTSTGHMVTREENIDLGKFKGQLKRLHIDPKNPPAPPGAIEAIQEADCIIAGPGDLYTTILPVLLIPDIQNAIKSSKARKIFVVNVANKRFETPNFTLDDFVYTIKKHCGDSLFDTFLQNDNLNIDIPAKYKNEYKYGP
ncbi:MAG TPA: gluconeogenesis factor YvcK family protein, partial [Candidatus Saccharimonadales bacterium]|nr:gluconeogenesis factor YvcK family protein [Candidatus Saccharimonadales bacterium]